MSYECYCDYDPPEWLRSKKIKSSRKSYKCAECGAIIGKGCPYEYTVGKWGGVVEDFHICLLCKELREWAEISVPCFCWTYGNLHEEVKEMVDSVRYDTPGLFFEYGRRIIKIKQSKLIHG